MGTHPHVTMLWGSGRGLVDRLAFYESYHSNAYNKAVHVVCVPAIVIAVLAWSGSRVGAALVGGYALLYLLFDPIAGATWALAQGYPFRLAALAIAKSNAPWIAWALFIGGWYFQLHLGHAVFEKRRPALMDGFVEAITTAPLFVWLEVLFLFGYNPELKAEVEKRAATLQQNRGKAQ